MGGGAAADELSIRLLCINFGFSLRAPIFLNGGDLVTLVLFGERNIWFLIGACIEKYSCN